MTRGRIAAAAVAILAVIGWWLFRGVDGPPSDRRDAGPLARGAESTPTEVATADSGEGIRGEAAPALPESRVDDPADQHREGAGAFGEAVEGVCVLEDGTALEGVEVHVVVNKEKGIDVFSARSGPDGSFREKSPGGTLSFREIIVRTPDMLLVSAVGVTLKDPGSEGPFPFVPGGGPLRLVFRDKSGVAHVRLVNADSGDPVRDVDGLKVTWRIPGGTLTMGFGEDQAPGGWIPIPEGRLPETGAEEIRADPSKVEVEFAMPGFEKGRLPLLDIKGRMEIRVRPVPPDATGITRSLRVLAMPRVVTSGDDAVVNELPVKAHLRWTGPDPAQSHSEVLGLPTASGPFSLFDLPDGSWEMEVSATLPDNTVVRGKKAFEKHGGTVDLGTIELVPAGKVVIRVVDSAGEAIPQAWAVIVRPEENPDQGRRLDLNQKGEVAVGDLEPGIGHRVVVKGLPRELEQTVVAAAEAKPAEFRWNEKLVPCRITLIVDGKAVANPDGRTTIPAVVQGSPLPRDKGAWKPDGTFEAKLVPGTYAFSALATPKEGGDLAVFSGEVTVPSGDSFEARLELQRGNR